VKASLVFPFPFSNCAEHDPRPLSLKRYFSFFFTGFCSVSAAAAKRELFAIPRQAYSKE